MLSVDVPIVEQAGIGEIFAVADGVGSAPRGMAAAQYLCDRLTGLYRTPTSTGSIESVNELLRIVNEEINGWGTIEGTDRPEGACAATVLLINPERVKCTVFHAGDTRAGLIKDGICQILTPLDQDPGGALLNYFGRHIPSITSTSISLELGDRLLLCSDGATKCYSMAEMAEILERNGKRRSGLLELATGCARNPSGDDVTVMVVDIE